MQMKPTLLCFAFTWKKLVVVFRHSSKRNIPKMMDFFKRIPTHMDFEGQRKAERIFQVIIIVFAVIGFIAGYVVQQFSWTVYAIICGFILSSIVVMPPWPYFRRNPLPWQKAAGDSAAATGKSNQKKKK